MNITKETFDFINSAAWKTMDRNDLYPTVICKSHFDEQTMHLLYYKHRLQKCSARVIRRKRWFKCRVAYYLNSDATFNFMTLIIELSGDVHPMPGPGTNSIPVYTTNRRKKKPVMRRRVESNCIKIETSLNYAAMNTINNQHTLVAKHNGQNKRIKIAHLNAESLKNRIRFWK